MFSRSDKSEDTTEELYDAEPKQRSPMVLAAVAGLLAIAGAFLLVRYLNAGSEDVTASTAVEASRQVLVVTQPIPAGTDVTDILAAPATYLSARAVPEQFVASSAVTSIEELRELEGLTLSSDALAGEQLLRGRFIDRSDFGGDGLIDRASDIRIPEGHHTVVVSLPTDQALGGNFGGGEKVSIISSFRVDPPDADPFEVSVVVLPAVEVITVQTTAEIVGAIDNDALGTATVGDVFVTLAVEPNELTDLTFAMKYGDIILAGALEDADKDDLRPITTIETIIDGATFSNDESLADLLGIQAGDDGEIEGADSSEEGSEEGGDDAAPSDDTAPADEVESEGASAPASSPAGVSNNDDDPDNAPPAPPASTSDEPEPAGPGETVGEQQPIDDATGNGALPPGN